MYAEAGANGIGREEDENCGDMVDAEFAENIAHPTVGAVVVVGVDSVVDMDGEDGAFRVYCID